MPLIDVTLPIDDQLACYAGDPPVRLWAYRDLPADPYRASQLTLGTHAGTHVDAPAHFFRDGLAVADLPLDVLCGPARVVDVRAAGRTISEDVLRVLGLEHTERVLLKTESGARLHGDSDPRGAHLTPEAARFLVDETPVRLVGIDTLSLEEYGRDDFLAHRTLLGARRPVVIVEGVDLERVPSGDYRMFCLPLRLVGADGSPARVVLERE